MERWPTTGPHAFNEQQGTWLTETLRCLKKPALRRRVSAGPAPPKSAPARNSKLSTPAKPVVFAGKRGRSADPVKRTSRLVFCNILYYSYNVTYNTYIYIMSFITLMSLITLMSRITLMSIISLMSLITLMSLTYTSCHL